MKKIMFLALLFASAISYADNVSTTPQKRNVLVEDFTGIHCSNCPDAHDRIEKMRLAFPKNVTSVAIHYGSYANPSADQPDFRTEAGGVLHDYFNIGKYGYPAGQLNRMTFDDATVINRGKWTTYSREIVVRDADVNIWAQADYNATTRNVSVDVELYYIKGVPENGTALCVALLQNAIIGPQSGSAESLEYEHNHMLRDMLTPVWGDTIATSTEGTLVKKHYDYTLPEAINEVDTDPFNMDILAYVISTDDSTNREVYNSTEVHFNCPEATAPRDVRMQAAKITPSRNYGYNFMECYITNRGSETITSLNFDFTLNEEKQTVNEVAVNIPKHETALVVVPVDMSKQESSDNSYTMKLTGVNGENYDGSSIYGTFEGLVYVKGKVTAKIQTDNYAADNFFSLYDKNGTLIKTFEQGKDGQVDTLQVEFEVTEADDMLCFEVSDVWGDGMLSPRAEINWYDAEGKQIVTNKNIQGFGYRVFFKYGDGSDDPTPGPTPDPDPIDDDDDEDFTVPDFSGSEWGIQDGYALQTMPAGTNQYCNEYALGADGTIWMYTYEPTGTTMASLDTCQYYLRLQAIDRNGKKLFPDPGFMISQYPNASWTKVGAHLCANADSTITVAVTDWRTAKGSQMESYHAYRFNSKGESVWPREGIQLADDYDEGFDCKMSILARPDGSNVFAWNSAKYTGGDFIERCHIAADGTVLTKNADVRLGTRTTDLYDFPNLVLADEDGSYYMVYTRTSSYVTYIQKYNADGTKAWSDTYGKKLYSGGWGELPTLQTRLNAVSDGNKGVIIGFNADPDGVGDPKPYLTWVKADGSMGYVNENGKPYIRIAYCDDMNLMQYMPKVIPAPDGNGFIAAIGHYNSSKGLSIQKVDSLGHIKWGDHGYFLTSVDRHEVGYYSIQPGYGKQFLVAWLRSNPDKFSSDVYTEYAVMRDGDEPKFANGTTDVQTLFPFQAYRSGLVTMVHPTENYWVFQWQQRYQPVYSGDRESFDAEYEKKEHYCMAVVTFDGKPVDALTGIDEVTVDGDCLTRHDNQLYNLHGQRVTNNYEGIVILNGKKVLMKK